MQGRGNPWWTQYPSLSSCTKSCARRSNHRACADARRPVVGVGWHGQRGESLERRRGHQQLDAVPWSTELGSMCTADCSGPFFAGLLLSNVSLWQFPAMPMGCRGQQNVPTTEQPQ